MDITCERLVLLNALLELQTVVQSRVNNPALSCVLLQANSTELVLTGTNTELTLYLTLPCQVITPGTALIQQRTITEWLKNTPGETVNLKLKDHKLNITVATENKTKAKCSLATYNIIDFPENLAVADALVNDTPVELVGDFERVIRLTAIATLDDANDPRAHLHALTFVFTPNKLTVYATDSFRLALQELSTDIVTDFTFMLLVKGVQTNLLSLLKQIKPDSKIKLYNTTNQAIFQLECKQYNAILALQKVAGKSLNINNIIPKSVEVGATVNRTELIAALQGAQVFGRTNHDRVYLTINTTVNTMTINSIDNQVGEHENNIAITNTIGGSAIHLILNATYLLEYLRATTATEIALSKKLSDRSPLILNEADNPTRGVYLMMPIIT